MFDLSHDPAKSPIPEGEEGEEGHVSANTQPDSMCHLLFTFTILLFVYFTICLLFVPGETNNS